ncbi:MAG: carbohydrate porin [Gammaproteobacteria bacterium]
MALSISQAYYENEFLAGDLVVDAGKLDVHSFFDDNAYANDETDQFLSAIFTRSADTTYAQLDYYYAPGVVAQYQVSDMLALTAIAANGNESGFNDIFSQPYYVGQVNVMPNLGGYEGNYRIYGLVDSRDSSNTTFTKVDSGKKTENTAWGLSFDQAIPGGVGLFARYSAQDDNILENTVESSWSFGGLVDGDNWQRPHDSAGIAYGSVNINDDPAVTALSKPDDEKHFEIFYKYGYLHHFSLTADLQVIKNIGGDGSADTVAVYGLRGQLNF